MIAATALARALRALGRTDEALAAARRAVDDLEPGLDWHVVATARALLVELEAEAGVPGATSGLAYGRLLSSVLWQQRLSTLQGARAALDVERLERETRRAVRQASVDPLTGVGNRRALERALPVGQERRQHSLVLVDLDGFKQVNDTYGHHTGDQVLSRVAAVLQDVARSEDVVVRLGGDEFVVLAPGAGRAEADALSARLEQALEEVDWARLTPGRRVRVSTGQATSDGPTSVEQLLQAADDAMYAVKRGRVRHADRRAGEG
ncbi:hypothetical protein GCM10025868_37790 [Angustibacter aerolatus]|uniref:GGDEF domain-containing protein n=1 Tax=Angustibacter aerolatus TaxID=1162965 RepID=A0ABQ6JKY6_9ACTN|nr:GGDEF domain-containing protein [Angustibacter aerolatus]GMA88529.1 hypothetical protein GCM10025868_37790 [Angustibacter aerolatus]